MNRDSGQAIVLAVVALAIAAVALTGLRGAQDRILDHALDQRAGEAAVEAAGAVIADELARGRRPASVLQDERVVADARAAAAETAMANRRAIPESVELAATSDGVELTVRLAGQVHRAAVVAEGIP